MNNLQKATTNLLTVPNKRTVMIFANYLVSERGYNRSEAMIEAHRIAKIATTNKFASQDAVLAVVSYQKKDGTFSIDNVITEILGVKTPKAGGVLLCCNRVKDGETSNCSFYLDKIVSLLITE